MDYRKLGRTDLNVSTICLGTMTWGEQNTEAEGHEQMDYAVEQGVNFFDTAELYSVPPKAETQGSTERIIGTWFASRRKRDDIILASKVVGRTQATYFRGGEISRLHRQHIMHAVEESLRRLKTDYIDLYQLHWPDRDIQVFGSLNYKHNEDAGIPIEETLGVLAELVEQGKIRHIGLSNETSWGTMKFLHHAEMRGLPRIVSIQNVYNLVAQNFEHGLSEIALREDVGLLAYSPLAQGYLTGKYQNGALPEGSRKQLFNRLQRYETPGAPDAIAAYLKIARDHDLDPAQMALQWVTTRPFVTSNIIGATTMDQLKTNIDSIHVELSEEVIKAIEYTNRLYTYPCP
ncbi:MAG: NADP(H)-dependent aldo-keto reductase [Hyphomicrobiales bacterium]|nr:NADP(H)-dependent aldo-keto reductase [Hyphomicrobiales bacterium]